MKGKKTDINIVKKVVKKRINTLKTASDIAREEGIPRRTVSGILKNNLADVCLDTESKKIARILEENDELFSLAGSLIKKKLQSGEDTISVHELTAVRKLAFEQNRLIEGKSTANVAYEPIDPTKLKDVPQEELQRRIQENLSK